MTLHELLQYVLTDTKHSLRVFGPELVLCGTIVLMLLLRLLAIGPRSERLVTWTVSWLPLIGALVALYLAAPWRHLGGEQFFDRGEIFTGLLIYDPLTVYIRAFLLFFAALFVIFTQLSGAMVRDDAGDFYTLVLGATVGMSMMAAANHLLMVFLAVEMASVPSYALAGLRRNDRNSSEAAIKYAVYGAGAAGVMLYGISLLAGVVGSAHLPTIAIRLAEMLQNGTAADSAVALVLGGLMVSVGMAFKLSAVPFHFWCPDVFEGATAEVAAFLSIASKGAALALLVRLVVGFATIPTASEGTIAQQRAVAASHRAQPAALSEKTSTTVRPAILTSATEAHNAVDVAAPATDRASLMVSLGPVRQFLYLVIAIFSAVTCTFGNLAAYGQTNIKRLLAYSTIAHAGYMMMPVAAVAVLSAGHARLAEEAVSALAFYIGAYLFMNLGAFAIVAFLRNAMHSEEIADYAGLIRRSPTVAICLSTILLSLIGIPPLAGFVAKFAAFRALVTADLWFLLVIGGLNTVISLFYYLRVIKTMTLDPEPETRLPDAFPLPWSAAVFIVLVTLPVIALGIANDGLIQWTLAAASGLLS